MQPIDIQSITFEGYTAAAGLNASALKALSRSPAACRRYLDGVDGTDTAAKRIGRALHAATLEPDVFARTFAVTRLDGRTREGRAERQKARDENREILTGDEFDTVQGMAKSVKSNRRAISLMNRSMPERSVFWQREDTVCKARVDLLGDRFIADVKTTTDIERFSPFQVTNLKFHNQAAWYIDGVSAHDITVDHFFFIVINNTPPFETAVFRLENDSIERARIENTRLFNLYRECVKANRWTNQINDLLTAKAFVKYAEGFDDE